MALIEKGLFKVLFIGREINAMPRLARVPRSLKSILVKLSSNKIKTNNITPIFIVRYPK
tara:strand:+ start:654 stop:830 length:177 start_codon:yes stop_codon:yes gene_type:complete